MRNKICVEIYFWHHLPWWKMSNVKISIQMHVSKSSIYRTEWWKRAFFDFLFWMNFSRVNEMHGDFSALEIASYLIPKDPFLTKKIHIFWVPIMMRKWKRIILMQWYNSIKQNFTYLCFESTRVLHTNFQEIVHVPSVNESSVFAILNVPCNVGITDFWYLAILAKNLLALEIETFDIFHQAKWSQK